MTAEQFSNEVSTLEHRVAEMPGRVAHQLLADIARSRNRCTPQVDDRLAQLHWQLLLANLSHRVSRAECETTRIVASSLTPGSITP